MEMVTIKTAPIVYDVEDAVIQEMEEKFLPLKVDGPQDKEGFQEVKKARIIVKKTRCEVEAKRKELKSDALQYGKNVDAEAKRIKDRLEPIETHLQEQEDVVKKEKERQAKLEQERIERLAVDRASELMAAGCQFDGVLYSMGEGSMRNTDLGTIDDETYSDFLQSAVRIKAEMDAEKAEDERKQKEEADRLGKIRKEQEVKQAEIDKKEREQAEVAAKLKADQEALA